MTALIDQGYRTVEQAKPTLPCAPSPASNLPQPSTTSISLRSDTAGCDYQSQLAQITAACDRWQQ